MKLNESNGNMYDFITHTANAIKGECFHDCNYCYMKRWGKLKPVRLDEKELKIPMTENNFIFVGSSCDMFAKDIPDGWIKRVLIHCSEYYNKYLFQTKNPSRIIENNLPINSVVCTTIETNRHYAKIMGNSPTPYARSLGMYCIDLPKYLTIEPILDFDIKEMIEIIKTVNPVQVNIGADSGNHKLPEPTKEKVIELIQELQKFTTIHRKTNLKRLGL